MVKIKIFGLISHFISESNKSKSLHTESHNSESHISESNDTQHHGADHGANSHHGIRLASWRWNEFSDYFMVCLMIGMAAVAKLIFHKISFLSKHFPESCLLIVLGVIIGVFVYYGVESHSHHFPEYVIYSFICIKKWMLIQILHWCTGCLFNRVSFQPLFKIHNFCSILAKYGLV